MGFFDIFFGKSKSENFSPEKFENFLRDGKKTEAIKLVKDNLNTDLKEARDFTDYFEAGKYSWNLVRQRYPSMTENLLKGSGEVIKEAGRAKNNIIEEGLTESVSDFGFVLRTEENKVIEEVDRLLKGNKKIEAIKMIRGVSGTGLKESKDFADYFIETGFSLELTGKKFPYIMGRLTGATEETRGFIENRRRKARLCKRNSRTHKGRKKNRGHKKSKGSYGSRA